MGRAACGGAGPDRPLPGGRRPGRLLRPTAHRFRFDPDGGARRGRTGARDHARPGDTWLDVGAGGGRYALPIALLTRGVIAVDPSPAMLRGAPREGMDRWGIGNVGRSRLAGRPSVGQRPDGARVRIARRRVAHGPRGLRHRGHRAVPGSRWRRRPGGRASRSWAKAAMTTVGRLLLGADPRRAAGAAAGPADLLTLLMRGDACPRCAWSIASRRPTRSFEALHERARRQLWLRPGSDRGRSSGSAARGRCRRARRGAGRCPRTGRASASSPGRPSRAERPDKRHGPRRSQCAAARGGVRGGEESGLATREAEESTVTRRVYRCRRSSPTQLRLRVSRTRSCSRARARSRFCPYIFCLLSPQPGGCGR